MKEFKGTKGPWETGSGTFGDKLMVYCDDDLGSAVADCRLPHSMKITEETKLANAKLIAAAPELLEALQSIIRLTEMGENTHPSKIYKIAEVAISKALD